VKNRAKTPWELQHRTIASPVGNERTNGKFNGAESKLAESIQTYSKNLIEGMAFIY